MKERSIALSISLLFHTVVVTLFLCINVGQNIKPKVLVLDFALEKERFVSMGKSGAGEIVNHKSQTINRKSYEDSAGIQQMRQPIEKKHAVMKLEENFQKGSFPESATVAYESPGKIAADPAGQVTGHEQAGPIGVAFAPGTGRSVPAEGDIQGSSSTPGGLRIIDYGKGGSAAQDFSFVNEILNKRFRNAYPDRALRMGWEGEVYLSFVIFEDGTVGNIEIVNNSGRSIFSDHARQLLQKIAFGRRLPYPLQIRNWRASYKLQ